MNRRGSLELNFKNIFNLVIGTLLLIAVLAGSYRLYSLFSHGEGDFRAKQNLDLLERQIKLSEEIGKDTSVIIHLPLDHALVGFGEKQQEIRFSGEDSSWMRALKNSEAASFTLPKPCDGACVCAYRFESSGTLNPNNDDFNKISMRQVDCREVDADIVTGSWNEMRFSKTRQVADWIPNGLRVAVPQVGGAYAFVLDGSKPPMSIIIKTEGKSLSLSQAPANAATS